MAADHVLPRSAYRAWSRDTLRYSDTDRQGHVNNACFASFCETGRVDFLYSQTEPLAPEGCSFVIARLVLDFVSELNWPGVVEVGTAVQSIGRSSVTLVQGLYQAERLVARSGAVIVLMDDRTRKSTPFPEKTRARLAELMVSPLSSGT